MKKYLILISLIVISVYCFGQARRLSGLHPTLNTPGYIYYDTLKILTAIAPIVLTDSVLSITGSALTKVDDANVTMTLGGTPSTALLAATSMSLGWTGTLAATRGGTSFGTTTLGDVLVGAAGNTWVKLGVGTAAQRIAVVGGTLAWRDTAAAAAGGGGQPDSAYFWNLYGNSIGAGQYKYLGTNNNRSLPFLTNSTLAAILDSNQRLGLGVAQPLAKFHVVSNAIGATHTTANSVLFENTTAAISGTRQDPPALLLSGNYYNAIGTVSQNGTFRINVNEIQGSNPSPLLTFSSSRNAGAYVDIMTLSETGTGNLTLNGFITQNAVGSANAFKDPINMSGTAANRYITFGATNAIAIGPDVAGVGDFQIRVWNATSLSTGQNAFNVYDSTGKIGINTVTHSQDYSALLAVSDTARGMTIPSMTTSQRDSMAMYVSSLTITNGGSGYTGTPTVVFATTTYPFRLALATGTQSGGVINTAPISYGGFYSRTPALPTVTGGPGTGAVLTPVMAQRLTTGLQIFNTTLNVNQTWDGTRWVSDAKFLSNTATLDFANLVAIGCEDLTITVTGAADGDPVELGVPNASVVANGSYSAWVSAANTVSVRFCALVSGDPASGTFKVTVSK